MAEQPFKMYKIELYRNPGDKFPYQTIISYRQLRELMEAIRKDQIIDRSWKFCRVLDDPKGPELQPMEYDVSGAPTDFSRECMNFTKNDNGTVEFKYIAGDL